MRVKLWIISLVICPLVSFSCRLDGQGIERVEEIPSAQLDTIALYINDFPEHTQLSLALINDSVTTFLGFLKSDGKWSIIDNRDSVFEVGSITKVFTSTLLSSMVKRGKVNLDHPISPVLPFRARHLDKEGVVVTFLHLANHTSGLPRVPRNLMFKRGSNLNNPYRDFDPDMLSNFFENQAELSTIPGTSYLYSNLGAGVLGYLLELKSGRSYEDLLQEYVFTSYRMTSSTTQRKNIESRLVAGRDSEGMIVPNWDFDVFSGAGAVLSSSADLASFVNANFTDDPVLALQRERTFSTGTGSGIALGWHLVERDSGTLWHWHNGGTGGYRSQLVMDVENRKAVVMLSNVSAGNPYSGNIDQLGFKLQETLMLYDTLEEQN